MNEFSPEQLDTLATLVPTALLHAVQQPEPSAETICACYDQLLAALAAITPFVPAPVADCYFDNPQPGQLAGVYLNGTVVCASIPGFSVLSARLADEGRRGSELLSGIVRQLFAALLNEVYAHGGGLIKFGGAGLTAFFDADRLGQDHSTLAALAALRMQARMQEFANIATQAGSFRLQLRIGVQRGRIFAAEVGNEQHRELIVAGRAISRAVVAQDSAAPGEVIVVGETRAALAEAQLHQMHDDLFVLDALSPVALPSARAQWHPGAPSYASIKALLARIAVMRPYVPEKLSAQAQHAQGEFRPVTVLFQDFYALSRLLTFLELPALAEQDPTIVGQVADLFYSTTQTIIHQFGGSISNVDTATFGNRCMAIFGAPSAHEDDPERAVRAALALREALPATSRAINVLLRNWAAQHPDQMLLLRALNTSLRQRTGIASGPLFAGVIGTSQRCEYTVMGETVQLAGQLMAAADNNAVLLSSIVRYAVRRTISTQPRSPLIVGDSGPAVPVFQVSAEPANRELLADTLHRSVALAGRERELTQVRAVVQAACTPGEHAGGVLALIGEPGIGKSRLIDEALRIVQTENETVTVVGLTCESYEQTTPYAVVAQLVRQIIAPQPSGDRTLQAQSVQRQLDALVPQWSRFAPLLAPLLNVPLPETELTSALTAEQRHDRLHDLVMMICFALAQRAPLVLVIDGLQWADASSCALISRIAAELAGQPLALILAYRQSPRIDEPWRDFEHTSMLELGDLPPDANETLLRSLLDGELPVELQPLIARARGTPFFLEETVGYLLRSGTLQRQPDGAWVCAVPVTSSTIPTQIEQLLVARLDQLEADTRALTQVGAVLGQHFSVRLLDAVYGADSLSLARTLLDELILVPHAGTEAGYEFRQALVRDVAYENILFARRRELHAQVAAAIEQIYADDLDAQRVLLAQHYRQAEQPERAFPHFLQAAQQAQARYANSEAITLNREAISCAPWGDEITSIVDLATAILLYENLGDVLALTGDYAEARDTYEWLLGVLKAQADPAHTVSIAALQRKFGSTFEQQGNLDAALHWFTEAAASIDDAVPNAAVTLERARIQSDTGWVHFRRNNLDAAQECLSQALARVAADEHPDEQARILNRLGGVAWTRGDMEQAQAYVEQSLAASERSGDLVGQANALNNLCNLAGSQGSLDSSIRYGLQAIKIIEFINNKRELAVATLNVGWSFYDQGEYQQAHAYFAQAVSQSIDVRDTYHQMRALLNLGRTFTMMKQWKAAIQAVEQSLFIALQLHLPAEQMENYTVLAEIDLQQGNIQGALDYYQQGFLLVVDKECEEYGRLQRLEAKLAFAQKDKARAVTLLQANEVLFIELYNLPEAQRTRKLLVEFETYV